MPVETMQETWTRSDVPCALCDRRLTNSETLRDAGSHGIVCNECQRLIVGECEECGERGVAHLSHNYSMRWAIANYARESFARMAREIHPECATDSNWLRWRDGMAAIFEARLANFVPARTREFWNIDPEWEDLLRTEDAGWRCEDHCALCDECGSLVGDLQQLNGMDVCYPCAMPRCAECNEAFEFESDARNCCASDLHPYDFRPQFRFWFMQDGSPESNFGRITNWEHIAPTDDLYLGVELETERSRSTFSDFLQDAGESHDEPLFVYGKSDGSLSEDGVEIVTMPATMDAFMARFPWDALANWNDAGAKSFHMGTCGFHVHVSRSFFSAPHMWRFAAWQMRNQPFCEALAQRNSSQWARWQSLGDFGNGRKPSLGDIVKGKESNGERYVAINFQNSATVELRYFRGNLRADAIRTRIEFIDALARFTRNLSARNVMDGALSVDALAQWTMGRATRYPNFAMWIMDNESNYGRNA